MGTIRIAIFDAAGVMSSEITTDGEADFRAAGREFSIDVRRAVTPAYIERAERAAVNARAQAQVAETQASAAMTSAATVEATAATLAGMVEAARKPARRKPARRKR